MTLEKGIHTTKDSNHHPQDGGNPHKDLAAQLLQHYISIAKCIYIYQLSFSSVTCHTGGIEILGVNKWQ